MLSKTSIWLTCVMTGTLFAQVGGRITGTVQDPSAAAISEAAVTVVNSATGVKQATKANEQGVYTFPAVPVGQYNIEISAPGFSPYRRTGVVIDVNSAPQVDVTLQLAGQSATVEVNEEAGQVQVEKSDTQLGQTITSQRITEVPLNGRSYTDLLAVQTGVAPVTTSATSSTSSGGSYGAVAVSGGLNPGLFSVNGQRESANGFMLNGANVEEGIAEGAAIIPNLDSIAEFRVLTSNFDAEYSNYSGGLVSVVTKSGTNQLHGSAFEFLRNTDLDGRGFFDPERAPYHQNQFGGTLGGRIKKDKIFFFGDYQATRNLQGIPDRAASGTFIGRPHRQLVRFGGFPNRGREGFVHGQSGHTATRLRRLGRRAILHARLHQHSAVRLSECRDSTARMVASRTAPLTVHPTAECRDEYLFQLFLGPAAQ
jgi:hypothetical protein